ncbi:DUF2164 domain-containing protein [Pontibacillus sp. HMF3514]|uniref:DUF2164 domain-containing protein n=1 Tax=Pontibacillus sp. HMF3514 TaxID=2692425 RepID=UPI0013200F09|nr:DUF2164 domain-containing protein [Pontibacillus sp. HMF3514]QHE50803.1 DUF2164 family protein [Pontibacillus sp. HMF3514]
MDIKISKDDKDQIIAQIQAYFEMERGEELGMIGAEQFYHYFVKEIGPYIYNQGVRDAKKMIDEKMMNIDEDITSLEKPIYVQRER